VSPARAHHEALGLFLLFGLHRVRRQQQRQEASADEEGGPRSGVHCEGEGGWGGPGGGDGTVFTNILARLTVYSSTVALINSASRNMFLRRDAADT
jgi:hypothetical protein